MSEKVGGIYYDVTLDTSKLVGAQREVERKLNAMGDAGDKLKARFSAIAGAVSAALAAIAVEGLTSKIVAAQRQFDVLFSSLKTVTGGADQASAAFGRLQKFASQTPYTLDQSIKGFVKLKALGIDPSERAMTSFGNTASAMGKDLMQMIEAVADASTGEFERLKEFGIKANVEGEKVKLTFQGVTTTVQNSASAITGYLVGIGETAFAGAMSERMKTLDGDLSNLEDSWNALYLTISRSGIGDAISSGVRAASEAIQEASNSIDQGRLSEYFSALAPVIAAAQVVAVSFAGVVASRLVSSVTTAAAAITAKAAATREANAATLLNLKSVEMEAYALASTATLAREAALAMANQAAANVQAARSTVQLLSAQAEQAAMNTRLVAGSATHFEAAAVERTVVSQLAAAKAVETEATAALIAAENALGVARGREAAAAVEATAATIALTAAQRAQAAAAGIGAMAARSFGAVVAALGGPVGIAITGLTLLALNWDKVGSSAKTAAEISEEAADRISRAQRKSAEAPMRQLQQQLDDAKRGMAVEDALIADAQRKAPRRKDGSSSADTSANLARREAYRGAALSAQTAIDEMKSRQMADLFPPASAAPSSTTTPSAKKSKGQPFDATGYLSTLEAQTADAYTRIGIIEEEAKRKADDLLKEKKISVEQHAQAVKLIEANAVQDRQELAFREATENLRIIEESGAKELELRLKAKAFADSLIEGGMTPAEKLRLEEAEKLAALEEALSNEYVTREKYEFAKQALLEGTQVKLKEIADREAADKNEAQAKMLQGYGQMFDGMAGIVETFSGKQNAAYKVLFAASKAFAVAESIIKIQQGIANAAALPFPANLGAMATVAASTASIISTIKGTQYGGGRQYGGAVSANSLYRVNETGRPEMFTAANGSQYMMPTASGRVTSADKVGGGGTVLQVNVNNSHPTAQVTATRNSSGGVDVAVQEIARQIRDNSGPVWSALRGSSNVQGRLG